MLADVKAWRADYNRQYQANPDAVRDFRGAMAGRGEKGLLITTATFTPGAREAVRHQ